MADAAAAVVTYFQGKGGAVYITTIKNISVDCDCNGSAAPPCMGDIGIAGSLDPVALDQCCLDLILSAADEGKKQIIDRVNKLHGHRILKRAEEHGIGTRAYTLHTLS
ncbi:MAG: DUF362 domain-containing protein [archaeon]|nr:DUF362 domain-containing protein [archaeon]